MGSGEPPVPPRGFCGGRGIWPVGGEGGGEGSAAWDPGTVAAPRVQSLGRRVLGTAGLFELPSIPGGGTVWGVYIDVATLVRDYLESSSPSQPREKGWDAWMARQLRSTRDQKRSTLAHALVNGRKRAPSEDSALDWKSGSQGWCSPQPRKICLKDRPGTSPWTNTDGDGTLQAATSSSMRSVVPTTTSDSA